MTTSTNEWEAFAVGEVSQQPNWTNPDCQPFSMVSHVTHIAPSLTILERRKLRAGLVFDESRLNDKRILVTWLSPNGWGHGFRYGNIRFRFSFDRLIEGKNYYWVENIAYKIAACRILITDKNHDSELPSYNPHDRRGPWWYDKTTSQHYFNGEHCLEFMFEQDLDISSDVRLDFVKHHDDWCSIHRNTPRLCPELGLIESLGGARFLGAAVSAAVNIGGLGLTETGDAGVIPCFAVKSAWSWFTDDFRSNAKTFSGAVTHASGSAPALARAALHAYAFRRHDFESLASMFSSREEFIRSCGTLFAEALQLPRWESLKIV